jgi:hypothetical protein
MRKKSRRPNEFTAEYLLALPAKPKRYSIPDSDQRGLSFRKDPWPHHVPVPAFGPRVVCTGCGIIGADARPNSKEQPPRESLTGMQWR